MCYSKASLVHSSTNVINPAGSAIRPRGAAIQQRSCHPGGAGLHWHGGAAVQCRGAAAQGKVIQPERRSCNPGRSLCPLNTATVPASWLLWASHVVMWNKWHLEGDSVIKTPLQALNLCLPRHFTSPLSLYKRFLSFYWLPLFCAFNSFQFFVWWVFFSFQYPPNSVISSIKLPQIRRERSSN